MPPSARSSRLPVHPSVRARNARRAPGARKERSIREPPKVALALAANQILSSATHLFAKGAVVALGALPVALIRFVLAAAALGGWQGFRRAGAIERRDWPRVLLLGVLAVPLNQGFFLYGMVRSTPSHASLLYALTPLVVFLLAHGVIRERLPWSTLLGIAVAFGGVLVILGERGLMRELSVLGGDLLLLVAVFAWSLYTVLAKPLLARYDAMAVTTGAVVSGMLVSLPAFLIPGAIPPLRSITPPLWGAILYLAIGTSAVAYPLWMYALRHLDASKVAIASNTQPVLTGALSWLVYRERFTPGFLLGAALTLAGVTWVETRRARS